MNPIRMVVIAMAAAGLAFSSGLGRVVCAPQATTRTSLVWKTGSSDELRGVSTVFLFTSDNTTLNDQLRDALKETPLSVANSYDDADVILMLVPEGTGLNPDLGLPPSITHQAKDAPLTAAILRRRDVDTMVVLYQQRFAGGDVADARDALVLEFKTLYRAARGA